MLPGIFLPNLFTNSDMTSAIESRDIYMQELTLGNIHCWWTGVPVGTLQIQWRNSIDEPWEIDSSSSVSVNGAGSVTYKLSDIGAGLGRVIYTPLSGSGNLYASWYGKVQSTYY